MRSLLISIGLMACISQQAQEEFPYEASLTDIEGNSVNSTSFSNNGKPIIIDFWGAFCKPCIVKYNAMKEVYNQWQADTGVKIIIVSIDDERMQSTTKKIMEKFNWPFEAYFDGNQELMNQLADGNSVPRTFIFDGDNQLMFKKTGAKIIPKDEVMDPKMIGEVMYGGGSMESITCDLSEYEDVIYKLSKN